MWDDVIYQPGEIEVIAYDSEGQAVAEKTIRTAGKGASIKLTPDRKVLKANGEDLCYINVSLTDKDGNPVPADNRLMKVKVSGDGSFKAIANGDPTCLESFQQPQMHLFSGQLTVLVQSSSQPGEITVEVTGKGVKKARLTIITE
jgi:beta-galactosidase